MIREISNALIRNFESVLFVQCLAFLAIPTLFCIGLKALRKIPFDQYSLKAYAGLGFYPKQIRTIGGISLLVGLLGSLSRTYLAIDTLRRTAADSSSWDLIYGLSDMLITTLTGVFLLLFAWAMACILELIIYRKTQKDS